MFLSSYPVTQIQYTVYYNFKQYTVCTFGQLAGSERGVSSVSLALLIASEERAKSARFERTQPQPQRNTNLLKRHSTSMYSPRLVDVGHLTMADHIGFLAYGYMPFISRPLIGQMNCAVMSAIEDPCDTFEPDSEDFAAVEFCWRGVSFSSRTSRSDFTCGRGSADGSIEVSRFRRRSCSTTASLL